MISAQPKTTAYVSVADAAQMIDRSERTIWRWVEQNKIGSFKRNGQRCIVKAEIDRLLAEMPELVRPLPERVEVAEDALEDHEQRLNALEQDRRGQAEINLEHERQVRELQATIAELKQLLEGGQSRMPHRPSSQPGQGRHYDPVLRGLPEGSLRRSTFARKHLIDPDFLTTLHKSGIFCMELHPMQGESERNEWWIMPEQHQVVIRYYQQQHLPYKHCDDCPGESTTLSI